MICGIGVDIVEIERIALVLEKYDQHFLETIFTTFEILHAPIHDKNKKAYYAARWAAKEAFSKALGCGIGEKCHWQEIEVQKYDSGEPFLVVSGITAHTVKQKGINMIHVSLSHENNYACAMIVVEG